MYYIFESERLRFRELQVSDAVEFFLLNADPEVIRFTGDQAFASVEEARHFLSRYQPYRTTNMGRWALERKSDGAFIGWCGLRPDRGEIDLGYRLHRRYWNQGYATEAGIRCLHFGFNNLKTEQIVGRTHIGNTASIRVLKKCGMQTTNQQPVEGQTEIVWQISRENFFEKFPVLPT